MGKKSGLVGVAVLMLPIIEVVALVVVGNALGLLRTIALFVGLSVFGAMIFKFRLALLASATARPAGQNLAAVPRSVGSAVIATIGGALIMLPGFVTAALGLLLQISPVRTALAHRVTGQFTTSVGSMGDLFGSAAGTAPFGRRGDVIDGDIIETDLAPDPPPSNHQSSQELT